MATLRNIRLCTPNKKYGNKQEQVAGFAALVNWLRFLIWLLREGLVFGRSFDGMAPCGPLYFRQ
ncbi:MAG: hypothetical protein WDZ50_01605, partial [Woeseia sp.]